MEYGDLGSRPDRLQEAAAKLGALGHDVIAVAVDLSKPTAPKDILDAHLATYGRLDLLVNDFVYRAVTDKAVVLFEAHFIRNYIHIRDVARAFIQAIDKFGAMRGEIYNVGLSDANLSKMELCERIKRQVPEFTYIEAPVGEDPDKRDYIVSNARIAAAGFRPEWSLDRGIRELVKGYTILRNSVYANV